MWSTWLVFCVCGFHSICLLMDGEGNGTPLQYSWLENPMDGGTWWATVHGVAKSWTQLSDFTSHVYYFPMLIWFKFNLEVFTELSSVQSLSHVWLFATPWITARQASLSITNSQSSPKLMCIKSVMPSSHLILCHPFLLLSSIPPSIWVFSNESTLRMRWPKYWSFSFSTSLSNEHPRLISFRMDQLDLLAVQGTLKSLLQNHN